MKFAVERVSDKYRSAEKIKSKPPCEGAFLEESPVFFSPWRIEINTLEELIEFIEKEDELIIGYDNGQLRIRIFDNFL